MRIIRGLFRGKKIIAPSNLPVRPTTDYAKESLFNILENRIEFQNLTCLDLFSGTGNISYEFFSRGASKIICVDANQHCLNFINKTMENLGCKNFRVVKDDVFNFLNAHQGEYDLIFADPPYSMEGVDRLPDFVLCANILTQNAFFILEHDESHNFSEHKNFAFSKTYGKVNFSFFQS